MNETTSQDKTVTQRDHEVDRLARINAQVRAVLAGIRKGG